MIRSLLLLALLALTTPTIVYLTELFRHGARYPVSDIYDGKETKPYHGLLTGVGMRQQYLLGSYLKRDYVDQAQFLNGTLVPREVEIFTDSTLRCYESAYAHAAGLFQLNLGEQIPAGIGSDLLLPPFESSVSSHLSADQLVVELGEYSLEKGYQPVPIKHEEAFFPSCANEPQLIARRLEAVAAEVAQIELEQQSFAVRMKNMFGLSLELANIGGLVQLYDTVVCDLNLGRPMPAQFTEKDFLELKYVQNYMFVLLYAGELSRVSSTPIAAAIIDKMEKVIAGKYDAKKLTVYSGHDTNVVPMLTFLNLTTAECVRKKYRNETVSGNCADPAPFASSIQFELHQRDKLQLGASTFFVKVKYNGDYYQLCQSNNYECDFQDFSARVKRQLVDYKKECGSK